MSFLVSLVRRVGTLSVLAGLATVLVLSTVSSSQVGPAYQAAATTDGYTPVTGATFNRPVGSTAEQRAIFTVLDDTIDATPAGATIRIAVFSFSDKATADRLIAAHDRGVNVQLIFDDHAIYSQEARLRTALGAAPDATSFVIYCHHSCRGTGGNMHDKLFLFSQAGTASNVVNVGSDNITAHNSQDQWSDMYTVVGDAALYFTYAGVFDQMKYDKAMPAPYIRADVNGYQPQFYPYPGTSMTTDPVYQALVPITCTGLPAGSGTAAGHTVVRISQHAWNGARGIYLANKVAQLKSAGCNVKVIYGVGIGGTVKNILTRANIPVSAGHHAGIRTHEKVLTVNGWYGDNQFAKIVWTGSHNWSDGALKRDEIIFRVEDPATYDAYNANFNDIWNNG